MLFASCTSHSILSKKQKFSSDRAIQHGMHHGQFFYLSGGTLAIITETGGADYSFTGCFEFNATHAQRAILIFVDELDILFNHLQRQTLEVTGDSSTAKPR